MCSRRMGLTERRSLNLPWGQERLQPEEKQQREGRRRRRRRERGARGEGLEEELRFWAGPVVGRRDRVFIYSIILT